MVHYYVLPIGEEFQVLREGRPKGRHGNEARALQSASYMAAIETAKLGIATEVLLETGPGQLHLVESFNADDDITIPPLPVLIAA